MKKKIIPVLFFIAYWILLVKVMVFKDVPSIRVGHIMLNFSGTDPGQYPNFIPFKTIFPYLTGYKGWIIAGINLAGNIAPLIPVGILLHFINRGITWKKSLLVAVMSGLSIEVVQTVLKVGIFDVDDVILNGLGVVIGYLAFLTLTKWMRSKNYKSIIVAAMVLVVAAAGAIYAIYPRELLKPPNQRVGAGDQPNTLDNVVAQTEDLCGGTGGTGEIIEKSAKTITIRRQDGVVKRIDITDKTYIRNSAGKISIADLKVKDRVTLVINEGLTASTVLVCLDKK